MINLEANRRGSGRRRPGRHQRGMAPSLELVILLPALVIMLGLIVAGGRIWFTRTAVTEAAYSGARAASMERTSAQAAAVGNDATDAHLTTEGVYCQDRRIELDVTGLDRPLGQPATVRSTVRCRVGIDDLLLPGIPGSIEVEGRASAVIDSFRGR